MSLRGYVYFLIAMFAASCGYAAPARQISKEDSIAHARQSFDAALGAQSGSIVKVSLGAAQTPALEDTVLMLVNRERYRAGLKPLRFSSQLAAAARTHNDAMAQGGFFEHRGQGEPDLYDRVTALGLDTDHVGENIFETSENGENAIATQCVKMWMLSEGHRRNMLEPEFEKTGIAIGTSADGMQYITEDFAH